MNIFPRKYRFAPEINCLQFETGDVVYCEDRISALAIAFSGRFVRRTIAGRQPTAAQIAVLETKPFRTWGVD